MFFYYSFLLLLDDPLLGIAVIAIIDLNIGAGSVVVVIHIQTSVPVIGIPDLMRKRKIAGFDADDYMVIGNSHDYSGSFFIGSCKVMLRCHNEFTKTAWNLEISPNATCDQKINQIITSVPLYMELERDLALTFSVWHNIPVDYQIMDGLIKRILDIETGEGERVDKQILSTKKFKQVQELRRSLNREIVFVGANLFGLFNGVTHYTTHVREVNEKVFGNVLGTLSTINDRAFEFCKEIATIKKG